MAKKKSKKTVGKIFEIDHPLLQSLLTELRDEGTAFGTFRRNIRDIGRCLAYEATRNSRTTTKKIRTPLETMQAPQFSEELVFIGIMRAGLGLLDGALDLFPQARGGHIGMFRSEPSLDIVEYFFKIPDCTPDAQVVLFDPMLATASTAIVAVEKLKNLGVRQMSLASLIAAPEGIKAFRKAHPDVDVYCVKIDRQLNAKKYILPGLGDAGDRIFGTKEVGTKR